MNKIILYLSLLLGTSAMAQNMKLPDNFFLTKLDNGLEVLVIEDASVPLATVEICVKNGSYTETPEFNGLSHLYEHMFFKANKDIPSQDSFMKRVQQLGISFNGTTSNERVNYFVTLSNQKVDEGLRFINSAIRYPLFLETEMKKENPVVDGEFQRAESQPTFFLIHDMEKALWGDLYSRKNPIGDHQIILTATTEKMRTIQQKYYWPNNSIIAVAGDVRHDEVFAKVKAIYGDWKPSDFDPFQKWPIPEFKPLEKSSSFVTVNANAQVPMIMTSYLGPDTRGDLAATYAADVFSTILGETSSRLQQELVDKGLAFQVSLNYQTCKYTGPIQLFMVPNPKKIKDAYEALLKNVADWDSDNYFTDEQLETAKNQLAISDAKSKESTSSFIHSVTYNWASANIAYGTNYVANVQKVTREDIKNYVRKYIKGKAHIDGILVSPQMKEMLKLENFESLTK